MRVLGHSAMVMAMSVLAAACGLFAFTGAAAAQGNTAPDAADDVIYSSDTSGEFLPFVEFELGDTDGASEQDADVAALAGGGFVAVWTQTSASGDDADGHSVRGRRFSTDGSNIGASFAINTTTAGDQTDPAVAGLIGGNFVVVWTDTSGTGGDTSGTAIRGRIFTASGAAVTPEFLINSTTANNQSDPAIVARDDGGFEVAWWDLSDGSQGAGIGDVRRRRFDADGSPHADDSIANGGSGQQFQPAIAGAAEGWIVSTDLSDSGVADGQGAIELGGGDVGNYRMTASDFPDVVSLPIARPVFTWRQESGGWIVNSGPAIWARFNDNTSGGSFAEFIVDNTSASYGPPAIALMPDDGFIIAWPANDGMFAQRFSSQAIDHDPIATGGRISLNQSVPHADSAVSLDLIDANGVAAVWRRADGRVVGRVFRHAVTEDTAHRLTVLANDTDADNDALTITAINGQPIADGESRQIHFAEGFSTVTLDGGTLIYDPSTSVVINRWPADERFREEFSYTVSDGTTTDIANVVIWVQGLNDDPVLTHPASLTVNEDSSNNTVLGVAIADPDNGDVLTVTITAGSTVSLGTTIGLSFTEGDGTDDAALTFSGVLHQVNNALSTLTYTPTPEAVGDSSITISVTDEFGATDTGTIAVTINNVNDGPDAVDDVIGTSLSPTVAESLVNIRTTGSQTGPAIARLSNGHTVVAWLNLLGATPPDGVFGRIYGADGAPVTGEIEFDQSGQPQSDVRLAALGGGGFVASWSEANDVYFRVFDNSGTPVTNAGSVDATIDHAIREGDVSDLTDGGFVVVWTGSDTDETGIFARVFNANGTPRSATFPVNTGTANDQEVPAVAGLTGGGFAVVWATTELTQLHEIEGRLFAPDGTPVSGELDISEYDLDVQWVPRIAALQNGGFFVIWQDHSQWEAFPGLPNFQTKMAGRPFAANGTPTASQFRVNQQGMDPGNSAAFPSLNSDVGLLADGRLIVTWRVGSGDATDGSGTSIRGRLLTSAGVPSGNDFQINAETNGNQHRPVVAPFGSDGWVIAFQSDSESGDDASGPGILVNFRSFPVAANGAHVLPVLANDTDADDDTLTITAINGEGVTAAAGAGLSRITSNAVTLPSGAGAALAENGILYDPTTAGFAAALPAGVTADDNFTYTISDGALTDTANVTVTVTGVNDAPTADDDTLNVLQDDGAADVTAILLAGDSDPDTGETAQLAITGINDTGTTGSVTLNAGAVSYSPNGQFASLPAGATAADSFGYTVSDPSGASDTAAVNVTVTGTNDAPVAANDALATTSTTSLDGNLFADNGSGADSDVDTGDSFTVTAVNGVPGNVDGEIALASGALLTVNSNGTVAYDPNGAFALAPGATTQDTFTYTITDGSGAPSSATVTVTITGNTPPDAVDDVVRDDGTSGDPTSDDFLVSTTTTNSHFGPSAAGLEDGGFIVAWYDNSGVLPDPSANAVRAQRFDSTGAALGDVFLVNTTTTNSQSHPSVAALADGGFVVAWSDNSETGGDVSGTAIRAQRYDAAGAAVGTEFLVNTTTASPQRDPSIGALFDGGFVVAWSDNSETGGDVSGTAIRAQRYDAVGAAVGTEFLVNTTTTNSQETPRVAGLVDGGFVIVWSDLSEAVGDTDGSAIRAHRYDAAGAAVGAEMLVNTTTANNQYQPGVGALSDGGFMIVWSDASDDSGDVVRAQRFASSGVPEGGEFRVNTTATNHQTSVFPSVDPLEGGGFIVVWSAQSQTGNDQSLSSIRAQRYDSTGSAAGEEFLVNTTSFGAQSQPSASALADGGFVVAWTDRSLSIRGRAYLVRPLLSDSKYSLPVLANDTDIDNDLLIITAVNGTPISAAGLPAEWRVPLAAPATGPVTLPSGSVVSLGDGVLDYDPTAAGFAIALPDGATGDDSFTYSISDGAATDTADVTVTLTGVNDAPSADADSLTADEDDAPTDVTAVLLEGDTDPDTGETAQLVVSAIDTTGTQGLAALNDGVVTYTPNGAFEALAAGQTANDSFGYTVSDPGGLTASATVTVTVQGENDPPVADADALTFGEEEAARDVTATLLNGDSDPDNGETAQLAVTAVDTTLTLGRVTLTNGVVTYDPDGAFNALAQGQTANDRFDYTITDPHGATATATATVTINGFNGYTLTVSTSGLGAGTVTSLPLGINCGGGGGCTALFTQNSEVALSALVAPGTTFEGWSGDCLDPAQPLCVVRMNGNRSVAARFSLTTVPEGRIVAATLPGARSGFVGGNDITVFMSVVSRATTPAQACRVTAPNDAPFTLTYRQINAQNEVVGGANPLFDLANGGGINFVLALTPTQTTAAAGYLFQPQIACENADLAPIEGVNSVLVSIGAAPVPDILSIGATPSADGVVRIPSTGNRINFLSAAAVNIGVGDGSAGASEATVTASVDTGAANLPVTLEVCETGPTGGCITPRGETEVTSVFAQNAAKFFAVFVRANGEETVPFNPANARVFLRFADASGAIRSVTSAAISAPAPANDSAEAASLTGRWSVLVRQPSGDWPSLRRGSLYVFEDGTAILDDGRLPRTLTVAESIAANDNEAVSFRIGNGIGSAGADGSIRLGNPLADEPGAFWGIREIDLTDPIQPGRFGDSVVLTAGGGLTGSHGGCVFTGQVSMQTGTGSVTLRDCAKAGDYRAAFSAAGTAAGPDTLTIANDRWGTRLEAGGSSGR